MFKKKPKVLTPAQVEEIRTKDFFDMILPGTIKFLSDHYIVGDSYRCVWAIREYPPTTEEQAILSQLADRNGVTLRIYHRLVESMEQRKIIQNATRRNRLKSGGNDVSETIEAEGNLQDVIELLANLRKNKEPLLHCSVFIELKAKGMEKLKELQSDIAMELTRSKISVDRLTLRQKEGFLSAVPTGFNQFGAQYDKGSRWQDMLRSQAHTLSENLRIPMSNLRWFAAFHNESHHPHIHFIAYSTNPNEGYLSEKGVMALRSSLAKDIFAQDLLCEYKKQTEHRDALKVQSREVLAELIAKINGGTYDNPQVEDLLQALAKRLAVTNGKKQYGYRKNG